MGVTRKTNLSNVKLERKPAPSNVQNSNPGATAGRVPLSTAVPSESSPNSYLGPTQSAFIPVETINADYSIVIAGNFVDEFSSKIRPANQIVLKRGNISLPFVVKFVSLLNEGTGNEKTYVRIGNFFAPASGDLTSFIGASGFPYASSETFVSLGPNLESSKEQKSLVNFVETKRVPSEIPDRFDVIANWEIDHSVKAVSVRWRSLPRFQTTQSEFDLEVLSAGVYTANVDGTINFPEVAIVSETGRGAKVQLNASILAATVLTGGTGYSTTLVTTSGGEGSGVVASAFAPTLGPSATSITAVNVLVGGVYTLLPSMFIPGGTGASAYFSQVEINDVILVEPGGNYLTEPTVELIGGSGSGGSIGVTGYSLTQTGSLDFVRVLEGGSDYSDNASVVFSGGGGTGASASLVIVKGKIVDVILISGGEGYTGVPSATVVDSFGVGASLKANVDYISAWNYEPALYDSKRIIIRGLTKGVPYELQLLASADKDFRGQSRYSDSSFFTFK